MDNLEIYIALGASIAAFLTGAIQQFARKRTEAISKIEKVFVPRLEENLTIIEDELKKVSDKLDKIIELLEGRN